MRKRFFSIDSQELIAMMVDESDPHIHSDKNIVSTTDVSILFAMNIFSSELNTITEEIYKNLTTHTNNT